LLKTLFDAGSAVSIKDFIARQFRRPSGLLGMWASSFMLKGNGPAIEWTIEQCGIKPDDTVLEIGFGPGVGLERCSRLVSTGRIMGLDFSKDMLVKASRRNKTLIKHGLMKLHCGDCKPTPFSSGSVDKVFAVNVVYFWHQPRDEFSEIVRILKPGGRMVLYLADKGALDAIPFTHGTVFRKYAPEELVALAISCGFSDARFVTRELFPDKYGHCIVAEKR
jgi:SAM-dependent methyltransferase